MVGREGSPGDVGARVCDCDWCCRNSREWALLLRWMLGRGAWPEFEDDVQEAMMSLLSFVARSEKPAHLNR